MLSTLPSRDRQTWALGFWRHQIKKIHFCIPYYTRMNTRHINSIPLVVAMAAIISGCSATIPLSPNGQPAGSKVTINDKREKSETVYRRDGVLEPIQYYGDSDFDTPPLAYLGKALERSLPVNEYVVDINKFRVIDIFPRRLSAGISGATFGALSSMGYMVFLSNINPQVSDNITCIAAGAIQGETFSTSSSVTYAISPFAGLVKHDASFVAAVNGCLAKLSEQIAKAL